MWQCKAKIQKGQGVDAFWAEIGLATLCSLVFLLLNGAIWPSSDDYNTLPLMLRLGDPSLLAHDFVFGGNEVAGVPYARLLAFLGRFLPLAAVAWTGLFLTQTVEFFALARIASRLAGRPVSTLVGCLLPVLGGAFLLFGNGLFYNFFYPGQCGTAATLLAVALIMDRRFTAAALSVSVACLIHPLTGIQGILIVAILMICFGASHRDMLAAGSIFALFLIPFALPAVFSFSGTNKLPPGEYRFFMEVLTNVRAASHFSLSAVTRYQWIAVLVCGTYILVFHLKRGLEDRPLRIAAFLETILFLCILLAVVNNHIVRSYLLFMTNPGKVTALLMGLFYAYIMAGLSGQAWRGYAMTMLALLCLKNAPSLFLALVLAVLILEYAVKRLDRFQDATLTAFCLAVICLKLDWSAFTDYMVLFAFLVAVLLLSPTRWQGCPAFIAGLAIAGHLVAGAVTGSLLLPQRLSPEPQWVNVCRWMRKDSPKGACAIVPPLTDNYQTLAERCAFVSYKHFSRGPGMAREWVRRMRMLKVFPPLSDDAIAADGVQPNFDAYQTLTAPELLAIKSAYPEVHYAIFAKKTKRLPLPVTYENEKYLVYDLTPAAAIPRAGAPQGLPLHRP